MMPKALRETEESVQIAVVDWVRRQYPLAAETLHHSPNEGQHKVQYRVKQRQMGVSSGFPDILLLTPKADFCGLAMELKSEDGRKPTQAQMEWMYTLANCGFFATWCKGFDAAVETIRGYLEQDDG